MIGAIDVAMMIYATNGDREPKVPVGELMQKNLADYAMSLLSHFRGPAHKSEETALQQWCAENGIETSET